MEDVDLSALVSRFLHRLRVVERKSEKTVETYHNVLKQFLAFSDGKARAETVLDFVEEFRRNHAPASVYLAVVVLRRFFFTSPLRGSRSAN